MFPELSAVGTEPGRRVMALQGFPFTLNASMEWHGLITSALPFPATPYHGAKNFSTLPFDLIQLVSNGIYSCITHGAIHQNKKIPIGFGACILTGA
jgi:hypothetical protein